MKNIGQCFVYGDNVNTDKIIPGRYLNLWKPEDLAKYAMEGEDEKFAVNVKEGDFIIGGKNFGCGSLREQAPIAVKAAGVSAIIAESFGRSFYRNSINICLPLLECKSISSNVENGDKLEIDSISGKIFNQTKGETYEAKPMPEFLREILDKGGLINYLKSKDN